MEKSNDLEGPNFSYCTPQLGVLLLVRGTAQTLQAETSNFHSLLVHLLIICHLIPCITQKLVTWRA